MDALTPVRPGWLWFIRLGSWTLRRFSIFTDTLRQLSFIHFARWSIVDRIPFNGPPQSPERLRYAYFFFESNFNGTWEDYIDTFAFVLPRRIRATWITSFNFPGPLPTGPFKAYIGRNEFDVDHYYSAYAEATTTMINAALRLADRYERFQAENADLSPEQFAAAYRRLLMSSQRHL
jgi:hypothetical protein